VVKHGRPVVMKTAVEEFERLKALETPTSVTLNRKRGHEDI
jgi:hypothetical protein